MKIALIGYGKMGKAIEKIAEEKGLQIAAIFDAENPIDVAKLKTCDVAIEFTAPDLAVKHINTCFECGVPIVVGTTGWYDELPAVKKACKKSKGGLFYASNFSLGVNLFFQLSEKFAKLMNPHLMYAVELEEIHHTQKLDSPSGTAITLAERMLKKMDDKNSWVNSETVVPTELSIISKRIENVPGTHTVSFTSGVDKIELTHTAFNRTGFAEGAVAAAVYMHKKKGVHTMNDLLN